MWQPVETAPKDGTKILACYVTENSEYNPITVKWRCYHPNAKGKECWRDSMSDKVIVTHWMPLPKPPYTFFSIFIKLLKALLHKGFRGFI